MNVACPSEKIFWKLKYNCLISNPIFFFVGRDSFSLCNVSLSKLIIIKRMKGKMALYLMYSRCTKWRYLQFTSKKLESELRTLGKPGGPKLGDQWDKG